MKQKSRHYDNLLDKFVDLDELKNRVKDWKSEGNAVVFTNGCFDILHVGHVSYLAKAAELGDKLVLGLNSDSSVKRLGKGDDRPINSEESRAIVLAGLSFIDAIVVFNEDTPDQLISKIIPNVLVKGGDYDPNQEDPKSKKYIVGSEVVKQNGGSVQIIDFVDGFSTTSTINKLKG